MNKADEKVAQLSTGTKALSYGVTAAVLGAGLSMAEDASATIVRFIETDDLVADESEVSVIGEHFSLLFIDSKEETRGGVIHTTSVNINTSNGQGGILAEPIASADASLVEDAVIVSRIAGPTETSSVFSDQVAEFTRFLPEGYYGGYLGYYGGYFGYYGGYYGGFYGGGLNGAGFYGGGFYGGELEGGIVPSPWMDRLPGLFAFNYSDEAGQTVTGLGAVQFGSLSVLGIGILEANEISVEDINEMFATFATPNEVPAPASLALAVLAAGATMIRTARRR